MTYKLSPEQAMLYEEGSWPARRLTEDICEWIDKHGITEPVVVVSDNGSILFALTGGGTP